MKEKVSKITTSKFSNQWTNPSGGTTYYFDIVFENGDAGSIGTTDMNSEKIKVGTEVTYTMINNKIKVTPMSNQTKPTTATQSNYSSYNKSKGNYHQQFLGYAWSYAKDFVVAGKTMQDVEELNQVARYIYDQIGDMMNDNK